MVSCCSFINQGSHFSLQLYTSTIASLLYLFSMLQSITVLSLFLFTGADFSSGSFVVTIPPNEDSTAPSDFIIPQGFTINDDPFDAVVQSFVLVGEIGADVLESFTCFQREEGETGCNVTMQPTARFDATRIQINDNDGRLDLHGSSFAR